MTRSFITLLVTAVLAACGSKSSTPKTTPTEPTGGETTAMSGSDAPKETPKPTEPDKPAVPAKARVEETGGE